MTVTKTLCQVLMLVLILALSITLTHSGGGQLAGQIGALAGNPDNTNVYRSIDRRLSLSLPWRSSLYNTKQHLLDFGGRRETGGYYITNDGIYKVFSIPDSETVGGNISSISGFAQNNLLPVYLALIPTACAVRQDIMPAFATLYNQKKHIEDSYAELSGLVTPIDIYSTLFTHHNEYIYYRTHDNLTSMGGYYVYSQVTARMGANGSPSITKYDRQFVDHEFYGSAGGVAPHIDTTPDIISVYNYRNNSGYTITRSDNETSLRVSNKLYNMARLNSGDKTDVFFGGLPEVMDIVSNNSRTAKLIVFGDETAKSYLPFLINDYGYVTFVNIREITRQRFDRLDINKYDQILLAFSLDTLSIKGALEVMDNA